MAELSATNNTVMRSYVWGLDLSGSMDGAGGVGGLLWVRQQSGSAAGVHFCAYDGNGNVVAVSAASNGSETARYEYGPFGEQIRATGPAARSNPFRFSTKRTDNTTDFVLYEYRVYNPTLGRWLSRDPIGEVAFFFFQRRLQTNHLVGPIFSVADLMLPHIFVRNVPLGGVDKLGLKFVDTGVRLCIVPKFAGHVWIEYPGGSCGYYPSGNVWFSKGEVVNPDPHASDPSKECTPVKLGECGYDVAKFVECVKRACVPRKEGYYMWFFHHCGVWANDVLIGCQLYARK